MAQNNIYIGPNLKKALPLNQLKYLRELDANGIQELQPVLDQIEQQLSEIPDYYAKEIAEKNNIVHAHYFLGRSDWYVLGWNKTTNVFYGYVILNGDTEMAEFGDFAFAELDQFNTFPLLMNLDFYWQKRTLNAVLGKPDPAPATKTDKPKKADFKYEYGCLMLKVNIANWKQITDMVDKADIYDEPGFGMEDDPHITVLFGFHKEVDPEEVQNFVKKMNLGAISVELTDISHFSSEKYDVLKFSVNSALLSMLNEKLRDAFPYTNSFPDYKPHITIGYLKKGTAKKHDQEFDKRHQRVGSEFSYSYPTDTGAKACLNFFTLDQKLEEQTIALPIVDPEPTPDPPTGSISDPPTGSSVSLGHELIGDAFFKVHPEKILGEEVVKPRGDRGEGAVEIIVKGKLSDALAKIDVPDVAPFSQPSAPDQQIIAKAKAKAIALALELELDLE